MPSPINDAFMKFGRRAETTERTKLVETFVDAGPLFTLLSTHDHQVMYGRRGTGKTHALSYLAESREAEGDITSYVDMRVVGSTGGIYADTSIPIAERATRLLVDTLVALHDPLLEYAVDHAEEIDLSQAGPILDRLADAITQVRVVGETEHTTAQSTTHAEETTASTKIGISQAEIELAASASNRSSQTNSDSSRIVERGVAQCRVHFGSVRDALSGFARLIAPRRIWFILDEWSDVPFDLQPLLADLLRRTVLPVRGITVKIGAIEHRSLFRVATNQGNYIGIELGADATANVNLDDFMVFDNDEVRAKAFFQEFLFRHFRSILDESFEHPPRSASQLIQNGFTQRNAFDEFVRATEGVPRDAINILTMAAQRALDNPISVPNIRAASKAWYQRDKERAVTSNSDAVDLLNWITDEVIGSRRARAFLLRSNLRHPLIDSLFDSRVLHLLKRGVSAHDQPGIRYDVYKLDFGCYVDLITTARAPQGLLPVNSDVEGGAFVDVPPDDYRSIRRAILDLDRFEQRPSR